MIPLGINTIVVSLIDVTVDHSLCLGKFQEAGLYILVDLADQNGNGVYFSPPTWNYDTFSYFIGVIDAFAPYSNILGFLLDYLSLMDLTDTTPGLPFAKAQFRDLKAYMSDNNYRQIPIGAFYDNTTLASLGV